jgi:hypothetical protein
MSSSHQPDQTAAMPHAVLDVVALGVDTRRWRTGTIGTVIETSSEIALVEISDQRGHTLDLITVTHPSLVPHRG